MINQIDELLRLGYAWANAAARQAMYQVPADDAEMAFRKALEAALKYQLPDDLYDSKDWKAGGYAQRVEWLHVMYKSAKQEVERLEAALKPGGEPIAEYVVRTDAKGKTNGICYLKPAGYGLPAGEYKLYTASPAQTPAPPLRLTDAELDAMNNIELEKLDYEVFEVNQQSVKDSFRAIETAVRNQAGWK